MKKTIPFDYFQEGQTIYYDIDRFEELEKITGKNTGDIIEANLNIGLLYSLLIVGLRHHNPAGSRELYKNKVAEYIEKGGIPIRLWAAAVKAMSVSGLFGVQVADAIIEDRPLETEPKNV